MAPANQVFGRFWTIVFLRVFMGLDEFLQVCDVFFCRLWRSCFIKNLVLLTKTYFFSQKTTQNKVLIARARPGFFRDLVDVGCMMMISSCGKYLSQPSLRTKIYIYIFKVYIYIEFKSFGGICCKGILTLQKTRFGGPGKPSFWSVLDYGFYGFLWVLMSFYRFATFFFADCGEAASSKTRFCWLRKPVVLAETI